MRNILTKEEINHIDELCEEYKIDNYTIKPDGSIDVDGDVNLYKKGLDKLPLKFGKVSGDFNCGNNRLTSLEGCPSSISGNFYCFNNELTSLEGCPSSISGDFDCQNNNLISLKFSPSSVGGNFYCDFNQLPDHFKNLYIKLSSEERKIFFKYHHDLRIWDGVYNKKEAQILYEEIKDGMR